MAARLPTRRLPLCSRDTKTDDRRSNRADDSRPLAEENENEMNAAGCVMKATGERTKVGRYCPGRTPMPGWARAGSCCNSPFARLTAGASWANTFPYGELYRN